MRQKGGLEPWYPESKWKNKNIKLNGQGPWINLFHLYASTMNTMTNHCPVTKAQPFNPLSTNFIVWAFNIRTQYQFRIVTN